jgi:hypothetical protein
MISGYSNPFLAVGGPCLREGSHTNREYRPPSLFEKEVGNSITLILPELGLLAIVAKYQKHTQVYLNALTRRTLMPLGSRHLVTQYTQIH